MAKTRLRDRIIAGVGALVFLISASTFTVFVLVDILKPKDKTDLTSQVAQQQQQQAACTANQTEVVLDAPEVYKTDADVTELKVDDLKPGSGATAKPGDCLIMKYYGTLAKEGTVFDESYTKPTAFAFTLGAGSVIKGWEQGLVGIKEGGTRRLVIPSDMAYGAQATSSIPPNSDLVFVVELLRIKK